MPCRIAAPHGLARPGGDLWVGVVVAASGCSRKSGGSESSESIESGFVG